MKRIIDLESELQTALNAIRPGIVYERYWCTESGNKQIMGPHVGIYVPTLPNEKRLHRSVKLAIAQIVHDRLAPIRPRIRNSTFITNKQCHSFRLELVGKWP